MGPSGQDGAQGVKGDRGEQGYSAYDLYLQIHPNYLKSETEWLDDYILGRLSLSDEFDVFDSSDFELGLFLGFNKFRLQQDLILPVDFIFTNHMNINLNGYSIEGDIKVETIDEGTFYIQHGMIIGNLIFSEVDDFIIDALVFGNIETYQVDSIGEITNTVDGFLSIFGDLNLKIENNYSLIINSYGQGVVTLDGTIDQLHINNSQLLIMEPFSMITHIEIHSNHELEITRNQTSVIGSINPINQVIFTGEEVSTEDPSIVAPEGYIIGLDMNLEFEISMGRYSEITAVMIEGQNIDENYYSYFNGILSIESFYLDLLELEVMFIDVVLDADYSLQSIIPTYHLMPNIESLMNGYEGINVSVSGVVTKILNHQLMFIEDESGVISIYGDIDGINVGDYIQVVGLKNIYHGLHQITNASIYEIFSHNHMMSAPIDYQYGMTLYQGMRLNFSDVMTSDLYEDLYGNMIFYIYDELNDTYYQAILDSRLEDYQNIKDVILSLDGEIINLNDITWLLQLK